MTAPLNFSQPIVPGVGNHDPIPAETAKAIIAQLVPDLATKPELKQQLDAYVGAIVQEQGALGLTPQRALEIAGAAQTYYGGTPQQIAQQNLVQRGLDLDRSKLPEELRERFAKSDGAELAQELHVMMQQFHPQRELTRQEALDLYYQKVAKAEKEGAYANGASYPILKTNDRGETSVAGMVYGDTRK